MINRSIDREELYGLIRLELGEEKCEIRNAEDKEDGSVLQVLLNDICTYVWYGNDNGSIRVSTESFDYKKGEPQRPSLELMSCINNILGSPICAYNFRADIRSIKLPGTEGECIFGIKTSVFVWGSDREKIIQELQEFIKLMPDIINNLAIFM